MDSKIYKTWVVQLSTLTPEQKRETLQRLKMVGVDTANGSDIDEVEDWLLPVLLREMERVGLGVNHQRIRHTKSFITYQKQREQLWADMERIVDTPMNSHSHKRFALARLISQTLLQYCITKYGKAIPPSLVLQNLPNWRIAMEAAFPGYVIGGLLPTLLK